MLEAKDSQVAEFDSTRPIDTELFAENRDMREQLELLRKRLLDLTNRNRLLNFRHTARSSLRVVDELPDQVLSTLLDGKGMDFSPVPEPSRKELVAYWKARGKELEDEEGNLVEPEKPSAREWARHLGIRAEWEAPPPKNVGEAPRKHRDRTLQTLLYPEEMTATLRHITRQARTAREETGANLLHLAIGFLEWRESTSSERVMLAPLILLPVELQQKKEVGWGQFTISWSGEDLQPNLTLLKRMEQDFGLILPQLEATDGEWEKAEELFRRVSEAVADFPQWTVRRYITLSLFQFGTLLLYRDLDADNWPGNTLLNHQLLRELLRWEEPESRVLPSARPESVDTELELVDLADSSQAQAMQAALEGRNLIIEGPPGTGKSQTITNLIAAFLARGKKVLFVSEKLAALEVVKQRLDRLGLGAFCLDLHSHRQQKRAVLERIEARLALPSEDPYRQEHTLTAALEKLKERRAELEAYLDILRQKPGRLERDVSDILVEAGKLRHSLQQNGVDERLQMRLLEECAPDDPFKITLKTFEWNRDLLKTFHGILKELKKGGHAPVEHPWRGIDAIKVAEFETPRLLLSLQDALKSANAVAEAWQELLTTAPLEKVPRLKRLPAIPDQVRKAGWLHALRPELMDAWALLQEVRQNTSLPFPAGIAGLEALDALLVALEDFPAEYVALLSPDLEHPQVDDALASLARQIQTIRQRQEELGAILDMEKALGASPDRLMDMAAVLNDAHFLSYLTNADYRAARKAFRELARLSKDAGLDNRKRAGLLMALANQIKDIRQVQDGGEWREALRHSYQGLETDVFALQRLRDWLKRHEHTLAGWPGLKESLLTEGGADVDYLLRLVRGKRSRLENLRRVRGALKDMAALPELDTEDGEAAYRTIISASLPEDLVGWLSALPAQAPFPPLVESAEEVKRRFEAHEADWRRFASHAGLREEEWFGSAFAEARLSYHLARMEEALAAGEERARQWLTYDRGRQEVMDSREARKLARLAECGELPAEHAAEIHTWLVMESMARRLYDEYELLRRMDGRRLSDILAEYRDLDGEVMKVRRRLIAARLAQAEPPEGQFSQRKSELTEMGLIRNELKKSRRHVPIRQLLRRAGDALQTLMPCFMMSPLSVAQYLEPGAISFDVILMDEASQLKPEHALGAIARASQMIIVGDHKQLPPTSFFDRLDRDEDEEEVDEAVRDSESILDLGAHSLPSKMLRWHYRSRHESLIRFSNQRFYKGQLVVFPSALQDRERLGIGFHVVEDGTFANGVNLAEARRVAQSAARYLLEGSRSLGVAAMNRKQAELISDLLDEMAQGNAELAACMGEEDTNEPFFVKNLENVQGDERDVIIISMTYGPANPGGRVLQRFGPINRNDGWRRLNVLFTRARERMEIYSSMRAPDVVVGENSKLGVRALHEFLHYAETGNLPQLKETTERPHEPESPFEEAVLEALEARGYSCVPQVGVDGYYIDIGIRDPNQPERFLLGVECDGARYHSLRSARDRDIIRQQHLENLGWRIHRIWSTDWFRAPERELQLLEKKILALSNA